MYAYNLFCYQTTTLQIYCYNFCQVEYLIIVCDYIIAMEEKLDNADIIDNLEENSKPNYESKNLVHLSYIDTDNIKRRCFYIKNSNVRGRAFVNLLGEHAGCMLLKNLGLQPSVDKALQKIESVLSKIDISEIFVDNKKIDVRCNFEDYKLFISKKQAKYNMLADFYMFIRIDKHLDTVTLLGFISKEDIDLENSDDKNYYIEETKLKTFEQIKEEFQNKSNDSKDDKFNQKSIGEWHSDIIKYIDGNIENKIEFLKSIAESKELRKMLIGFEHSEKVFRELAQKEKIVEEEINKDLSNISRLADAFIQSKGELLKPTNENSELDNAKDFKIECSRANLEKLFHTKYSNTPTQEEVENKSNEEVVDSLLLKGKTIEAAGYKRLTTILRIIITVIILAILGIFTATYFYTFDNSSCITVINKHIKTVIHHK